jgi:hypothetical protein
MTASEFLEAASSAAMVGARAALGCSVSDMGWDMGYEALFRANEIDVDILPELTEVDLEELGVPLGHLKRLLRSEPSPVWPTPRHRRRPPHRPFRSRKTPPSDVS